MNAYTFGIIIAQCALQGLSLLLTGLERRKLLASLRAREDPPEKPGKPPAAPGKLARRRALWEMKTPHGGKGETSENETV